jgi:protoporphyrin/coproporphyrin ferrochelatase
VKQAVLLLAHGAPERVEDVPEYLKFVRSGRPVSPQLVEEISHRYAAIGGASPLRHWTRVQAEALEKQLGIPVFYGMRNWHPFIRETMDRIRDSGVERLAAICLAPQYSKMSVGFYFRRTQEAKVDAGASAEIVWAKSYHDSPLLIEAFAEKLRALAPGRRVLFTAHSLPEKALAESDPYERECRATAASVAAAAGVADWDFAFQSQGMTEDRWLGPTVESTLDRYAAEGIRELVLHPIGFVCDHVEVLFDVDVLFKGYAAERGIALLRPESLNGSAKYTEALAEVAWRALRTSSATA